ncbi:MAG: His Kinase (phospho-acceptor) domain [Candidatus Binatota bacterium]|jgi:nitrogen-specific signal transduction histidine kinase|nr:His Kinase (phospho-acceptor) domain [Candidatus Binatota bacterium]
MSSADGRFLTDDERRNLTHELRNSLGAMLSATEILERRYQPEAREARLFRVIFEEITRMRGLIENELGTRRDGKG